MRLWACGVVMLALACVCSASAATSSGWIQLKTPSAAASWRLRDVATLSARKALLVGIDATTGGALVARYDGQRFRAVYRAATPSVLQGVAKTRTGQAWAVGYTNPDSSDGQDPLIAHFAGSWHASTSPHLDVQGNLYDVAAVNDHNVWAVGSTSHDGWYNTRSLVEHYNGRRWRVVPSPNPSRCPPTSGCVGFTNDLVAVAATHNGSVFVVGIRNQDATFLLRCRRHRWHRLALPRLPGFDDVINGVVARTAHDVWFVGEYQGSRDGTARPLALHWNGTVVRRVRAVAPPGWDGTWMQDVARTSTGAIYAVGTAIPPWPDSQAVIWRLTRHGFIPMRTPKIIGSSLGGVSAGGGTVLAVGGDGPIVLRLRVS